VALVVFVNDVGVVFGLLLLFLGFGFRIGSEIAEGVAVGGPGEIADTGFVFGDGVGFAAFHAEEIDLLPVAGAVGKESEHAAVRGPARVSFGLGGVGELTGCRGSVIVDPEMAGAFLAFKWIGYDEDDAGAVGRELRVLEHAEVEETLRGESLLGRSFFLRSREGGQR
jgi:hypothetical protein